MIISLYNQDIDEPCRQDVLKLHILKTLLLQQKH